MSTACTDADRSRPTRTQLVAAQGYAGASIAQVTAQVTAQDVLITLVNGLRR